jgi:uncharacterized membrane protein
MTFLEFCFWITCIVCLVLALRFGERDERHGMIIIVIGSIATAVVATIKNNDFQHISFWFLLIDLCVLLAFVRLLFNSQKYWPIWVGSLQLIAVIINLLDILLPKNLPDAYVMLQGFWVYPMLFAIMAGTYGNYVVNRRKQV